MRAGGTYGHYQLDWLLRAQILYRYKLPFFFSFLGRIDFDRICIFRFLWFKKMIIFTEEGYTE